MGRIKIEEDSWLTRVFGYSVFKVSLTERNTSTSAELPLTDWANVGPRGNRAFLYAKVPTSRVDHVRNFVDSGFGVVDVSVTLGRLPGIQKSDVLDRGITVRESRESDREAILNIASSCFRYSRFHLDPQIPVSLGNSVKRAWVESYFEKTRGERLLTAILDGEIAGFMALLSRDSPSGRERVIDLIGVSETFQGRGVGRQLVMHLVEDFAKDAASLKVGTQAANVPSIRLYEKCGFCMTESAYVLHAHLPNERM